MSTTSPPAPPSLFTGLDMDQLIAEEEQHQALESQSPPTLGKRLLPSRDVSENEDEEPPGSEDEGPAHRSAPAARLNSGSLRVGQAIRKASKRLKLSNENTSLIEQFSKASATSRFF